MLQKPANLPVLWDHFLNTPDASGCLVLRHWSLILINAGTWNCIGKKRNYLTQTVDFLTIPLLLLFPQVCECLWVCLRLSPLCILNIKGGKQACLGNMGTSVNIQLTDPHNIQFSKVSLWLRFYCPFSSISEVSHNKRSCFSWSPRGSLIKPKSAKRAYWGLTHPEIVDWHHHGGSSVSK